jgi:hypothetical protein
MAGPVRHGPSPLTAGIFPAFSPAQHAAARRDSAAAGIASLPARLLESLT